MNGYARSSFYFNGERQHQQRHEVSQSWQDVPRSWENVNPEAHRITQLPAFIRGFDLLTDQNVQLRSSGNSNSSPNNPLTVTNIDRLNDSQVGTDNMRTWMSTNQRDGPWDGVGHVIPGGGSGERRTGY